MVSILLNAIRPPIVIQQAVDLYKAGYSPIIVVCGKPRVSKTTKAYLFAHWFSWLLFKRPWPWRKETIVSVDQLVQEMAYEDEGKIYLMDEVERQLSKKMWAHPESRLLALLNDSQAYKHYIMILIIPKVWQLGTDHATSVNFVIPVHSRQMCQPYRCEVPFWDINLKKKEVKISGLGHFDINYKKEPVKTAFAEELKELEEFKKFINVELKEKIMDEALAERGLYNPRLPISDTNMPDYIRKML